MLVTYGQVHQKQETSHAEIWTAVDATGHLLAVWTPCEFQESNPRIGTTACGPVGGCGLLHSGVGHGPSYSLPTLMVGIPGLFTWTA